MVETVSYIWTLKPPAVLPILLPMSLLQRLQLSEVELPKSIALLRQEPGYKEERSARL